LGRKIHGLKGAVISGERDKSERVTGVKAEEKQKTPSAAVQEKKKAARRKSR